MKAFRRRLENVLKTTWRCFEDVFARRLEDALKTFLKTSWRRMTKRNILVLIKASWRHLEDVFWRRTSKPNMFVLVKTSSEDEDKRRDVFIKTNVCWEMIQFSVCRNYIGVWFWPKNTPKYILCTGSPFFYFFLVFLFRSYKKCSQFTGVAEIRERL